jgi:hypothetical protein
MIKIIRKYFFKDDTIDEIIFSMLPRETLVLNRDDYYSLSLKFKNKQLESKY